MTTTTYRRRKTAGLCPLCGERDPAEGKAYCRPCAIMESVRKHSYTHAAQFVHIPLLAARADGAIAASVLDAYPGPLLAHCGRWWIIEAGDVACGACGTAYGEEAP
ncbi:MAG TPA: hypothetical protein VI542_34935 [Candidatus Tectomicrobia bacterium]